MDDLSIDPFVASRGNFPQDDSCGHIISILPSWSSLRGGNVSTIKLKGEDSKEVRICRLFGVPHRLWGLWLAIDSWAQGLDEAWNVWRYVCHLSIPKYTAQSIYTVSPYHLGLYCQALDIVAEFLHAIWYSIWPLIHLLVLFHRRNVFLFVFLSGKFVPDECVE